MKLNLDMIAAFSAVAAIICDVVINRATLHRDRRQATIEAYRQLEEECLLPLDKVYPAEIKEIAKDNKSIKYKEIEALIAKLEIFCIGLHNKIYDKEVAYDLCHGFFENRIWPRVFSFIPETKVYKDDYYENIHNYYEYMKSENEKKLKCK